MKKLTQRPPMLIARARTKPTGAENMKDKLCETSGSQRKKAGKYGHGLCPFCYPMGGKRREIDIAADSEIDFYTMARKNSNLDMIGDLDEGQDAVATDAWTTIYLTLRNKMVRMAAHDFTEAEGFNLDYKAVEAVFDALADNIGEMRFQEYMDMKLVDEFGHLQGDE